MKRVNQLIRQGTKGTFSIQLNMKYQIDEINLQDVEDQLALGKDLGQLEIALPEHEEI